MPETRIIKRYANRKLYDTEHSRYVTLDQISEMIRAGDDVKIVDNKTKEDLTTVTLAQIIFEEENKGQHLLPIQFLRQLIRFYGDSLQAFVPSYLEMSMESFTKSQQEMRDKFAEAMGGKLGFKDFQDMTRQNMAMFERAMKMFAPFSGGMGQWGNEKEKPFAAFGAAMGMGPKPNGTTEPPPSPKRDEEIRELKDQIAAMRQQIADLAQRKS